MTTYSISLRHIKIHPMVQTELIPHRTRQGWNLVLQVRLHQLARPQGKKFLQDIDIAGSLEYNTQAALNSASAMAA